MKRRNPRLQIQRVLQAVKEFEHSNSRRKSNRRLDLRSRDMAVRVKLYSSF